MRKERLLFLKIALTVGIMVALPVIVTLTNLSRESQDIRSKAVSTSPTPSRIIFVPFSFSKDKDDDDLLDFTGRVQIRNGFVPPIQTTTGPQFTAVILDQSGTILQTVKFSLPQFVAIDGIDAQKKQGKAELKKVSANNQGLTLPFVGNASFIKIINPKGETVKLISIQNANSTNNTIYYNEMHGDKVGGIIDSTFAANGTFNIAIIGDNYNGDNLHFQSDVNDIAAGLLSIEPFKTYKASIIFYTQLSTVPICSFTTTLTCNDTYALQQASGLPYDKVFILYNGPYGGYAYLGAVLAYGTNATNMATTVKQGLFIHELAGHTLGGLMDEYSYGTTGASYAPNCSDFPSCPSWNTVAGLGCFSSCGFTNLYRATDNASVMNTAFLSGVISFDAYSAQVIAGKLASYLNPSPPTPTIPPPIPTPTITLSPSPTPTVSLQPTPTSGILSPTIPSQIRGPATAGEGEPIISITPSITPVPSPSDTPTPSPTQPLTCSFPNFCTREKFCAPENALTIECTGSTLVCCQGQIPSSADVTLTITQRFSLLPTMAEIPRDKSSNTPTPIQISASITPTISVPTSAIKPPQPQTVAPTTFGTNIVNPNQYNVPSIPTSIPLPSPTPRESYPLYPTPTPYKIEDVVFERTTPTPQPRLGVVDILAAPSRFINNLVKNFFSIFRR